MVPLLPFPQIHYELFTYARSLLPSDRPFHYHQNCAINKRDVVEIKSGFTILCVLWVQPLGALILRMRVDEVCALITWGLPGSQESIHTVRGLC